MTSRAGQAIELALLRELLESVADEMATVCMRTAVSPNIKERRDLSAAVFDGAGRMVAHAAHIPVHLGAMPLSVRTVLGTIALGPGDVALINDPYAGGTHLPDITAVLPVFAHPRERTPAFVLGVRAHHADVGGAVPGSMAPQGDVFAEGLRIPPLRWMRAGVEDRDVTALLFANMRDPDERHADLAAQAGALRRGRRRLEHIAEREGSLSALATKSRVLLAYATRIARAALHELPDGTETAELPLEVPDVHGDPAVIRLALTKRGSRLEVDFDGTSPPVGLGMNATEAVTHSAVYYFLRCLCPPGTPANDGLMDGVHVRVPAGSLLAADAPHPVAGGNVETSQRIVDALWLAAGSLWPGRMPAPGSGSMSNWTFGPVADGPSFPTYYETLPGGGGAGPAWDGADAIQQHMTNTRSTPTEALEARWPVRVERMTRRPDSGGPGRHVGGTGLLREIRFLAPAQVACLMTRHDEAPPGVAGGGPGARGGVRLVRGAHAQRLEARGAVRLEAGDLLRIETPGGGGWGARV